MGTIGIYPGSFDPFTLGHYMLVKKMYESRLFDKVVILIANNPNKKHMFNGNERREIVKLSLRYDEYWTRDFITIESTFGRTVDILDHYPDNNIVLVRGLRDGFDLAYENQLAIINKHLKQNLQTIYFPCDPAYGYISSFLVRNLIENDGDITGLVSHPDVKTYIQDQRRILEEFVE